jgi:predicted small secreted protein
MRKVTAKIERTNPVPILVIGAFSLMAIILSACNTTEGLGEDIESAGSALENEAEEASD